MDTVTTRTGRCPLRAIMRNALFAAVLLVVVVAPQSAMHAVAMTHPGDIKALNEVKQALNASSIMVSTCVGSWNFAS